MSYLQKLCDAYDVAIRNDQSRESVPLVPVGFARKKVMYWVQLTKEGEFVQAGECETDETRIIPSTPAAEGRTGTNGAPYPLVEQVKYLDGTAPELFNAYLSRLDAWCGEEGAPKCLQAISVYLKKHTLKQDMASTMTGRKAAINDKGMVRFEVHGSGDVCSDEQVKAGWSRHIQQHQSGAMDFCYVEGRVLPICENYPKVQGNAKLISAKDTAFPFQYKGRFVKDADSAKISLDATLRAHKALEWLVVRQGFKRYGMTWVMWNSDGQKLRVPIDDDDFEDDEQTDQPKQIDMFDGYAKMVKNAALGRGNIIPEHDRQRAAETTIMGMMAATDGRMSMIYYQELPGTAYEERLKVWYKTCCWWLYDRSKKTVRVDTPSRKLIAQAVLGAETVKQAEKDMQNKTGAGKVMRELMTRLMNCIMDQKTVPNSMTESAFYRACTPLSFTTRDGSWSRSEWNTCLCTACALIHRAQGEQAFSPELDRACRDRSYLYGRLLAVVDRIEIDATKTKQSTNAVRIFQRFAQRPFDSWAHLHDLLLPYIEQLKPNAKYLQMLLEEIESSFEPQERLQADALSWTFLQGFSGQTQYFYQKHEQREEAPQWEYHLPDTRSALYGCMIGIADAVETIATKEEHSGRTNALALMRAFAAKPCDMWAWIHDKLLPYFEKLGENAEYYHHIISMVEQRFQYADRCSNEPLDSSYLNSYYQMRRTLLTEDAHVAQEKFDHTPENATDREACFGEMLALAKKIERIAQDAANTPYRSTNAERLLAAMRQKPKNTWDFLHQKLEPYQKRLPFQFKKDVQRIITLENKLTMRGWLTDAPLKGIYLHSYYTK